MKVKIKTKVIFEALHARQMHPIRSNFNPYWNAVEDFILEQAGFNRGSADEASIYR